MNTIQYVLHAAYFHQAPVHRGALDWCIQFLMIAAGSLIFCRRRDFESPSRKPLWTTVLVWLLHVLLRHLELGFNILTINWFWLLRSRPVFLVSSLEACSIFCRQINVATCVQLCAREVHSFHFQGRYPSLWYTSQSALLSFVRELHVTNNLVYL